jgi:hypothetical protein
MISFMEWLKKAKEIETGWSKTVKVPTGAKKDFHPEHPENAVDPESKKKAKKK